MKTTKNVKLVRVNWPIANSDIGISKLYNQV
jgi:hypothetical protein